MSRPDERRFATVLFADLVGFTAFSESADPEHVKQLVDTCFEALGADITAYGGQVDKIIGDAMVALFGAPIAHEDDAERAVRCALQMQHTISTMRDHHDLQVEMRIGVNTGEVLVGALRAGGDYTAMGDVVNTASRLQTAAVPGTVVVGSTTHAATLHAVRYESLGSLTVKGREESVDAWCAIEALARPGLSRRRLRAPLVGRDAESTLLRGIVDAALAREHAQLILLTGDAGVGKSRLAEEVACHAETERGAIVLKGQCVPYGEDVWWPIAETIRAICDVQIDASHDDAKASVCTAVAHSMGRAEDDNEVARVGKGLLYLLGFPDELHDVDPTRARDDALRSARALYGFLASKAPLVLVISDVHWADELVLDLFAKLLEWLRTRPFVLVATARPELSDRWSPGPGRHDLSVLNLEPLGAAAVGSLVRELLGADTTPELVALLHERSGGNPFFVEELAALIRESGTSSAAGAGQLPATLQGLVSARLDALDAPARNVLEDCAVVGATGSIEAVHALAAARHGEDPDAHRILEQLAERELLLLDHGEYTFPSEIVRDVAYATLTKSERARRHFLLGELLADALDGDDSPAALERVAHHYGTAAELMQELGTISGVTAELPARALEVLERAADRARGAEIWKSSARLYEQALAVVPRDAAPDVRGRLLLGHARALAEQRETVVAREEFEEVLEIAAEDPRMTARALTLLADIEQFENRHEESIATFERSLALWRELGDEQGVADAMRGRGLTAMFMGDLDGAESYFLEALDVFRRIEDRRGEAWALQNLATISFFRGDAAIAEERIGAAQVLFEELGDWGGLNWSWGILAWVRFMQGRIEEAERIAREQIVESEASGNRWVAGILGVLLGNVALWSGRPAQSLEQARDAVARFRAIGDAWGESQALYVLVRALAAAGRIDDAFAELDVREEKQSFLTGVEEIASVVRAQLQVHIGAPEALASALHLGGEAGSRTFTINSELQMLLGLALLQAGRADEAVAELEAARERVIDADEGLGAALRAALALALVTCGDAQRAAELAADGEGKGTYLDQQECRLAGAFAALQSGDPDAADRFDASVAAMDDTESRLDQAIARLARSHAWTALGRDETDGGARKALAVLGHDLDGWDRMFTLAARTTAHSA